MNEDVFPMEQMDFPLSHVSFSGLSLAPPVMTAPRHTGAFLREEPLDRSAAEPMEVEEDCPWLAGFCGPFLLQREHKIDYL